MSIGFAVDERLCGGCGQCVRDCPAGIIEEGDGVPSIRPDREVRCLQCQHCLAICPTGAISILGKRPEDSLPLDPARLPTLAQADLFVRSRRSIRQYRDENVDGALLQRLLSTLANVPTGVNARKLTFTIVDDRDVMKRWRDKVYGAINEARVNGRLTNGGTFLGRVAEVYSETGRDVIFRGAPHAIIVSAPREAPCAQEDVVLALAYFELLAQAAGLGTVWWGYLKNVLENFPDLKPAAGLAPGHLYYAMLFGVPDVTFARTVQRDDAAVVKKLAV